MSGKQIVLAKEGKYYNQRKGKRAPESTKKGGKARFKYSGKNRQGVVERGRGKEH